MNALLETQALSVSFGGVHAVRQLNLRVEQGTLVGLIGPNGAGKTTAIDALTGFVKSSGSIVFDGQDVTSWPVHRRSRSGLVRTWQSTELFADLTVAENLRVGTERQSLGGTLADLVAPARHRAPASLPGHLERFGLGELADQLPSSLSHGQRKLVGVARALAASPKLLLVDEPAAGLDSQESQSLGASLRGVVDDGTAMLLVDHDMGLVLSVCDYIYVIDSGALIAEGPPSKIRTDPAVIKAYLGESDDMGADDGNGPGPEESR